MIYKKSYNKFKSIDISIISKGSVVGWTENLQNRPARENI